MNTAASLHSSGAAILSHFVVCAKFSTEFKIMHCVRIAVTVNRLKVTQNFRGHIGSVYVKRMILTLNCSIIIGEKNKCYSFVSVMTCLDLYCLYLAIIIVTSFRFSPFVINKKWI